MKVKNIVFSGFAAAVLMGVAADANAVTHVVTKGYIDDLTNTVSAGSGNYVTGVTQTKGRVESVATTGFDQEISSVSTHANAPTSQAVYEYVTNNDTDTTYTAGSHITITGEDNSIAVNDVTNAGGDINATDTGLTTGKAVYEYVTANDDNTTYTGSGYVSIDGDNEITVTNITSEAGGITDTSTALTTGKAVYEYVTNNDTDTTYTAGSHITITGEDNSIAVNDVTNAGGDINSTDTGLTTGKAVYEYVTQLTGAVLPDGCDSGNCSLVKLGGQLQWVDLTTPLDDQ